MDLCEAIGAEPYLAGNVGSGTPQEMRDWLEYLTFDGDSQLAIQRAENGREKAWKAPFFGIGNENWGCGGDMTVEYYADLYRRYSTFCRDFSENRLTRVGCGPGSYDEHWIRVMMQKVGRRMQGLSLHKYTVAAPWNNKLPATGFGEKEWFAILHEGVDMDRFLTEADKLMSETDPEKRIKIYLDEWGAWYREEPGTPDYGLYQQNTLRDAILAGLNFHIFHEHNDRLAMANIAQTVNVLQALILTKDEQMLLTPTYHVFDMFQVHHDATRLPVEFESPPYEFEGRSMPAVSLSASRDKLGRVHVTLVNAHAREGFDLSIKLPGIDAAGISGRILTAEKLDEHNTFESPQNLVPQPFDGVKLQDGNLEVKLPARSVVVLELKGA